jgi:hypothetical protein
MKQCDPQNYLNKLFSLQWLSGRTRLQFALSFIIWVYPCHLYSLELTPFDTHNQSPLIQIYGLPSTGAANVTPLGSADIKLVFDLSNNYINDSAGRERIVLDGESYRWMFVGRYGIAEGMEVGAEIPYIVQGGGFLDGFIEGYHNTFGFPRGLRDQAPSGRLLYQYQRNGINKINVDTSGSGLGDLRLTTAFQFYQKKNENPTAATLRASLKLPTGNSDHLYGSGSTDLALWLTASSGHKFESGLWSLFGSAGAMGMNDGKVLQEQQRNLVGYGSIGVGWRPFSWIGFKIQINGHTPFYRDSDLVELSASSAQVTVGGSLALSTTTSLDIGVSEDIIIKTAPDVVFHIAIQGRFGE